MWWRPGCSWAWPSGPTSAWRTERSRCETPPANEDRRANQTSLPPTSASLSLSFSQTARPIYLWLHDPLFRCFHSRHQVGLCFDSVCVFKVPDERSSRAARTAPLRCPDPVLVLRVVIPYSDQRVDPEAQTSEPIQTTAQWTLCALTGKPTNRITSQESPLISTHHWILPTLIGWCYDGQATGHHHPNRGRVRASHGDLGIQIFQPIRKVKVQWRVFNQGGCCCCGVIAHVWFLWENCV